MEETMKTINTLTFATTILALLFGVVVQFGGTQAQAATLKEQLVGTWTLVSNDNIAPSGTRQQIFGPHPKGILILAADGRYAQIMVDPRRPKFKGRNRLSGTPDENAAVVHATAMHFGTWSVDEANKTLTVHMDANIFPNDDGMVSKRTIELTGDELKQFNPAPSSGGRAEVVWKRVK
jgi:Lipocalin-like domain